MNPGRVQSEADEGWRGKTCRNLIPKLMNGIENNSTPFNPTVKNQSAKHLNISVDESQV